MYESNILLAAFVWKRWYRCKECWQRYMMRPHIQLHEPIIQYDRQMGQKCYKDFKYKKEQGYYSQNPGLGIQKISLQL